MREVRQHRGDFTGEGEGQTDYKRRLAYAQLGIDPKDVEFIPFLSIQMRRIARLIHADPLLCLTSSEDLEARKVARIYESIPHSYHRLLPVEAYCLAAGVSPWRVLEAITLVAVRQSVQAAAIVAAVLHPSVVEKTVETALRPGGIRERTLLHRAVGFPEYARAQSLALLGVEEVDPGRPVSS